MEIASIRVTSNRFETSPGGMPRQDLFDDSSAKNRLSIQAIFKIVKISPVTGLARVHVKTDVDA